MATIDPQYQDRFNKWTNDFLDNLHNHDSDIDERLCKTLEIEGYRDQFRGCINAFVDALGVETKGVADVLLRGMPLTQEYAFDRGVVDRIRHASADVGAQLLIVYDHYPNDKEVNKIIINGLRDWLPNALIERTRGAPVEEIEKALQRYLIQELTASISVKGLPVFEGMPDAFEAIAAKWIEENETAIPKDDSWRSAYNAEHQYAFYHETLPQLATLMRHRLADHPLDELAAKPPLSKLIEYPNACLPIDQMLALGMQSEPKDAKSLLMSLDTYPSQALCDHAEEIAHLMQHVSADRVIDKLVAKKVMRGISPYGESGQKMFETLIPPHSQVAQEMRTDFKEFMTLDYLIDQIQAHRNTEKGYFSAFADTEHTDDFDTALRRYEKAEKTGGDIHAILNDIVERECPDADELTRGNRLIRHVASLLNTTQMVDHLVENCFKWLDSDWKDDNLKNQLPFLQQALDASKPYLKKSMLDDLQDSQDGRMLLDDIREINQAALKIAEYVTLGKDKAPLRSIDSRVGKMTAAILERFEKTSGHFDPKHDIDDNAFEHML